MRNSGSRGDRIECLQRRRYGNRHIRNVLELELAAASVEADVVGIATVCIQGITRRLDLPGVMTVVPRHVLFMLRRAVRTILAGLHGHGARLQRQIQPDGREQAQDLASRGMAAWRAVSLVFQRLVTKKVFSGLSILDGQDYV